LAYETDPRLQEMDFGQWEGRAWQDIAPAELQAWTDDFANYAAGRDGESVSQVMARVASAFDELQGPADTLWITHAGVMRAVHLLARGVRQVARADQWPRDAPAYGQWCTLKLV
jgi:alpha-ribazole phosphatase